MTKAAVQGCLCTSAPPFARGNKNAKTSSIPAHGRENEIIVVFPTVSDVKQAFAVTAKAALRYHEDTGPLLARTGFLKV
ncbi:hypothetical protein O0882_18485 [Janthinobacterium sp. SUN073]|uniref:hypothetical protein n=1 Tax=Janthinobacterium sp. SUN073 TaxID=3004102 RepID=UPI0025B21E0E|nr:hypothetical protein [Janthinobacterium sp. SUN073]MDN2698306.1 hypothetical protein [Janthinobacterium sp. SUN073]